MLLQDFDLAPTPATLFMKSATRLTDSITRITDTAPTVGNAAIYADSTSTACRAAFNYCSSSNPVAKSLFAASCVCGVIGAASSGTAIATSTMGVPTAVVVGSLSTRAFNRAGKHIFLMGNVTNGNITNINEIRNIMDQSLEE